MFPKCFYEQFIKCLNVKFAHIKILMQIGIVYLPLNNVGLTSCICECKMFVCMLFIWCTPNIFHISFCLYKFWFALHFLYMRPLVSGFDYRLKGTGWRVKWWCCQDCCILQLTFICSDKNNSFSVFFLFYFFFLPDNSSRLVVDFVSFM